MVAESSKAPAFKPNMVSVTAQAEGRINSRQIAITEIHIIELEGNAMGYNEILTDRDDKLKTYKTKYKSKRKNAIYTSVLRKLSEMTT